MTNISFSGLSISELNVVLRAERSVASASFGDFVCSALKRGFHILKQTATLSIFLVACATECVLTHDGGGGNGGAIHVSRIAYFVRVCVVCANPLGLNTFQRGPCALRHHLVRWPYTHMSDDSEFLFLCSGRNFKHNYAKQPPSEKE